MIRLMYISLATMFTLLPIGAVWYSGSPAAGPASPRAYGYHHTTDYIYFGGGHGGWLGNTYGRGRGDYDALGDVSGYRGGGPGGGGK